MSSHQDNRQDLGKTEFDLHGIVGIRVLNACDADIRVLVRQLGPIQQSLTREPDIIIRFLDRLTESSRLMYLGVNDVAFDDQEFLILQGKHKSRARVQIPFEHLGQQCTICCERGLLAIPLLIPIINLTALNKGMLPLHASAFIYKGIGALVTGWAKGGKTETLLAFMANGAQYVGDEWVYLSADGTQMYGIPEPIRVWDWHLQDLPEYRALVGLKDRARLRGLSLLVNSMELAVSSGIGSGSTTIKLMTRLLPLMRNQLYVHLPPHKVFGSDKNALQYKFDKVFFVNSHVSPEITIDPIDSQLIAERMVFSLIEERLDFISAYLKYRFAFPDRKNGLIENAEEIQRKALKRVLQGKEAYAVGHPYPVYIPALFEALEPIFN